MDNFVWIAEVDRGDTRWNKRILTVLRWGEPLFGVEWERGLTEMQDGYDWFEDQGDYVTLRPMVAREVTTTVYDWDEEAC